MTQEELNKIVEQHQHWLNEDCEGWEDMKADSSEANLRGASLKGADLRGDNLRCADLSGVDLRGADLRWANLSEADLSGANLRGANLSEANLSDANLRLANLSGTNLSLANLSGTNFSWADLSGADLRWANLSGTNLSLASLLYTSFDDAEKIRLGQILTEPMTGYKKTREGTVITAEIPAGAIVFCINGSKCRTNRAKITDMDGRKVLHSQYDSTFAYRLGQEIEIKDFNLMYNVECANGFHFFKTRDEAEEYS